MRGGRSEQSKQNCAEHCDSTAIIQEEDNGGVFEEQDLGIPTNGIRLSVDFGNDQSQERENSISIEEMGNI